MNTDSTVYRWHNIAVRRPNWRALVIALVVLVGTGVLTIAIGYPIAGTAMFVLALTSITGFKVPAPQIIALGPGVEVLPRPPLKNSHYVFPSLASVMAILITVQCLISYPDIDVRLPIVAGLSWLLVVVTSGSAIRQRGNLLIDSESIAVGRHAPVPLSVARVTVVMAKNNVIPYVELVDTSGKSKKRLIFPEKYYGLDHNSLYSTVRHLAEADEAIRRAYSPELIREMLLFKPDHDVPIGESIEVRVVAQPTATTS